MFGSTWLTASTRPGCFGSTVVTGELKAGSRVLYVSTVKLQVLVAEWLALSLQVRVSELEPEGIIWAMPRLSETVVTLPDLVTVGDVATPFNWRLIEPWLTVVAPSVNWTSA